MIRTLPAGEAPAWATESTQNNRLLPSDPTDAVDSLFQLPAAPPAIKIGDHTGAGKDNSPYAEFAGITERGLSYLDPPELAKPEAESGSQNSQVLARHMQGPFRKMVLSGREPKLGRRETESIYGIPGEELASVELNGAPLPPADYSLTNDEIFEAWQKAALKQSRDHEMVVFDVSRGRHGKPKFMVTTRAFLGRLRSAPRILRGAMLRLSGEVHLMRPGDELHIGRGVARQKDGRMVDRWLPRGAARSPASEDQGTFTVTDDGISYLSKGEHAEYFIGHSLPQEESYDRAVRRWEAAVAKFNRGDHTVDVEATAQLRNLEANLLPAIPRRREAARSGHRAERVGQKIPAGRLIERLRAERLAAAAAMNSQVKPPAPGSSSLKPPIPGPRTSPEA